MELRHLRHFVAVAEELNFHRAARRLNMAQPPLSQSIRRLEDGLGVQLLDRERRSVALTRAGVAFLEEARTALKHAELACKLALREAEAPNEIRVSFTASAMYRFLPQLLVAYQDHAPGMHVHLREQPSPLQVEGILSGDCDIGIVSTRTVGMEACQTMLVESGSLAAAIPDNWPLAARRSVSLPELAEHPFILPPEHDYTTGTSAIVAIFRSAGVMPQLTQGETHISSTLALVGAGLGCTITAASAQTMRPRNVRFVPLSDGQSPLLWGLHMIWRPQAINGFAGDLIEFVRGQLQDNPALFNFHDQ